MIESITEQHVKLAAKMYRCRDAAKKLYGKDYQIKIADYRRYIFAAMQKYKLDSEIKAAMKLVEDCKDIDGSGVAIMNILAACVEIIEPT